MKSQFSQGKSSTQILGENEKNPKNTEDFDIKPWNFLPEEDE